MEQPYAPHRVIAQRIKELRQRHGWSAQRLAEEMTAAGIPWERMVVTKLETGKRQSVSVEEMLALAYVLDVAPIHLLIPTDDGAAGTGSEPGYRLIPTLSLGRNAVREWIRGNMPLPGQDARFYLSERPVAEWNMTFPAPAQAAADPFQGMIEHLHRQREEDQRDQDPPGASPGVDRRGPGVQEGNEGGPDASR